MARQQFFYGGSHSPLAQLAAAATAPTPPPAHQRSSEPITTLRVPSSAAVASLISAENDLLRRPTRIIKEETPDREMKHRSFLVDNLCRASASLDSNVASEVSDDRVSIGSLSDEVKFNPLKSCERISDKRKPEQVIVIDAVKSERKDSCDSIVALNESDEDQSEKETNKSDLNKSGLDLLNEGIERLEKLSEGGLMRPRLSSTPPRGARHMSVDGPRSSGGLRLLCDVALMSDVEEEDRKSPKARSRSLDSQMQSGSNSSSGGQHNEKRHYSSPKAEQTAKAFIASKSVRVADVVTFDVDGDGNSASSWKMGSWEENVRQNIANIQRKYKEKYKELYKLQHLTAKKQKVRRPSAASPPKKIIIKTERASTAEKPSKESASVWLKKSKKIDNDGHHTVSSTPVRWEIKNKQDLSDITTKFKSLRPNPFENLLRLSANKSIPKPEPLFTSTPKSTTATLVGSVTSVCATSPSSNSSVDLTNATEKSRHSSPPRKVHHHHHHHSHHSRRVVETLVIKSPKQPHENGVKGSSPADIPKLIEFDDNVESSNPDEDSTLSPPVLEPMAETKIPLMFKIKKKHEVENDGDDDDDYSAEMKVKKSKKLKKNKKDKKEKKSKKERKMKVVVDDEEGCDAITDKDHEEYVHKKKKSKKSKEIAKQGKAVIIQPEKTHLLCM